MIAFLPILSAAALATVPPSLGSEPMVAGFDDTSYPTPSPTFDAVDPLTYVTPDMDYPGPHASLVKTPAAAPTGTAVTMDDTTYPTSDAAPSRSPAGRGAEERIARACLCK